MLSGLDWFPDSFWEDRLYDWANYYRGPIVVTIDQEEMVKRAEEMDRQFKSIFGKAAKNLAEKYIKDI